MLTLCLITGLTPQKKKVEAQERDGLPGAGTESTPPPPRLEVVKDLNF